MKWIYGIICLGFIVFFHELGHFLAAKLFGVDVEAFSIGFGPVLLHRTVRGTDYRLSLLPLGGYCAMKGEKDFAEAIANNSRYIDAPKDSLYGIHPFKRAFIGFAGPFFNLIFAFMAFVIIALAGYTYYSYSTQIQLADEVYPEVHSAARDAGLLTGDIILSINGSTTSDFSDIIQHVGTNPDKDLVIVVNRNGETLSFTVRSELDKSSGIGKIGVAAFSTEPIKREAQRHSFFPALWQGVQRTGSTVALTLKSIAILFRGVDFKNALSGPAGVAGMLGDTVREGFSAGARQGITALLDLMAFISISLFIMNLLPIPILDGGLILFAFIECIFRRPVHPKIQYYVQYVGMAFIAVIFLLGMTSDIYHFSKLLRVE
ncbi:MAG: site-2 protease family protein [Treponema sp.]|nr:site-2 protease family protein [Treponema sp.]